MDELLMFLVRNTLGALILAVFVFGVTRVWRNPPVVHVLWLLVLLKLVAPPIMGINWSALVPTVPTERMGQTIADLPRRDFTATRAPSSRVAADSAIPQAEPRKLAVLQRAVRPNSQLFPIPSNGERHDVDVADLWRRAGGFLFWIWLGGAALGAAITTTRVTRFCRRLQHTLPASERLRGLGRGIVDRFGLSRQPDLRYVDSGSPLVCCFGRRPVILLPIGLFGQLDDEHVSMILAHEVAHLCRRDHWVRVVELIISTVYWWNPLVWIVRRQMHQAEEQCCDAWVRWAFPDCPKRYAEVVLLAADSINFRTSSHSMLASSFLGRRSLKARIEMILQSRFAPSISRHSKVMIALAALIALPVFAQSTKSQEQNRADAIRQALANRRALLAETSNKSGGPNAASISLQASLAKKFGQVPDKPSPMDFPHVVRFEQGVSKLSKGDQINITEVRGTAETMTPGNIYWIKGTYSLASHDRAGLMASVTAASAAEGTGPTLKVQSVAVTKGTGTFTLLYAMTCKGWPHVSFYPHGNGSDFGGTYFGTGDSVLRHWWGEVPAAAKQTAGSQYATAKPSTSEFPYAVNFELGETRFLNGDKITISDVRGTNEKIVKGNIYCVKGTYTLASHNRAMLSVYVTAADAANGRSDSFKTQDMIVNKGDGTFTMLLPMSYKGWPHVTFYPAEGGDGFGGVYFGTGNSVLAQGPTAAPAAARDNLAFDGPTPKFLPPDVLLGQRLWDKLGLRLAPIDKSAIESIVQEQRKQWELMSRKAPAPKLHIPSVPLPYEGGLRIVAIRPDSPASRSHMGPRSIIVGVDRYQTVNPKEVLWILDHRQEERADPEKLRLLVLIRDGAALPVDLMLGPQK